MRFSALCENTTQHSGIVAEHGFSLLIESAHCKVLFDMGQTDAFLSNAARMNLSLSDVDIAVLSHGHYDHSGGLKSFLEINSTAPVFVSQYAFGSYYNADCKYIGPDTSLRCHPQIRFTGHFTSLAPGFSLFSCNDLERPFPVSSFGLTEECGTLRMDDRFLHEQYLLILHKGKRILVSGCSHKGIENIVSWFQPDVFIGGFHMMKVNPHEPSGKEYLNRLSERLLKYNTVYYTAHCTGTEQYEYLKEKMKERLHYLSCGDCLELPV